ncbi:HAD-IA family hydrolase [Stutzerimonas urumqiensis]|uniref:HAD-IA family hydrolase n=1 Tax=Stutzerimonas urumqiensis TaxID=638269 RepID=UPI003BACBA1A
MPAFDLLICDCDGVLVDSEIISHRVLFDALTRYVPAETLEPLLKDTFGLTVPVILEQIEREFGLGIPASFDDDLRAESEARVKAEVEPIAGAREALLAIDLPLAVASNSRRHNVLSSLERAGLTERVAGNLFSADMVTHPKPAPDVYLLAAERMGVAPSRCLVVEDSTTGATAALAAGMTVLGFTGASHIQPGHDRILKALCVHDTFDDMARLPALVAELRR